MIDSKKKVLIGMGHPAHYHLFKHFIQNGKFDTVLVISDKDILEDLLVTNGLNYYKISDYGKKQGKFYKLIKLFISSLKLITTVRKEKPDILIGCLSQLAWVGWFLRVKVIFFAEDDYQYTSIQGQITYPFVSKILTAEGVSTGPFSKKQVTYPSYQKLAYTHPDFVNGNSFQELQKKYNLTDTYYIIRLVKLHAHHDKNIKGISSNELNKIIEILKNSGQILISTEGNFIDPNWGEYIFKPDVNDMHQLMFFSNGIISDSQSMTVEAALLGVPNIRINDFKGKISILNELEFKFNLTKSFFPGEITTKDVLNFQLENKVIWQQRKVEMLQSKINPIPFYENFISQEIA